MPSVHRYKRIENSVVHKVKRGARALGLFLSRFGRAFMAFGRKRFSLMFVPHSEKKVYNLQINNFSVIFTVIVLTALVGTFFWYGASFTDVQGALSDKTSKLKEAQASLDLLRDETARLMKAASQFETALGSTLGTLGLDKLKSENNDKGDGDLSAFFNIKETDSSNLKELDAVRGMADFLSESSNPIQEIGKLLDSQSTLLTDIPNLWPIKGGIGHISMYFGQNENPFTGQWYIHKGLDISTYRQGDPVVATANGQVVTVDNDVGGFGLYIIIKHKHGFYTRYAHLQKFAVSKGDKVQQGQVVGYIGNTGLSTGPHLHYEVHIGSDVVDPLKYLNIRSSLAKAKL